MSADDAARQEALRRYRRQTMHVGTAQDREKAAFEAGAQWQREQLVTDAEVEAAARALGVHRWKDIGVRHVSCECGEVLETSADQDILTEFPADEVFREHLARAALTAAKGASNG